MSKINISYDTQNKAMKAEMDGKKINDIHSISTYHHGGGKHSMSIMSQTPNEDENMTEQHTIYASEEDFAYVGPDGEKKLPIHDCNHVRAAVAALSAGGFRGNKVSIPADALAGVKSKVRGAWHRCFGDSKEKMPGHLQEDNTASAQMDDNEFEKLSDKLKKQLRVE